jgi:hypothetical protein
MQAIGLHAKRLGDDSIDPLCSGHENIEQQDPPQNTANVLKTAHGWREGIKNGKDWFCLMC